ncbi:histone acetyltransferase KAT6B [Gracilaria domingensis]|nr:histone acetyltransferase KAT6B [Gracilaria domingensis]
MVKQRPIPLHTWQLDRFTLTPTACHLQAFENRKRPDPDPLVTLRFSQPGEDAQAVRELYVPASMLRCSSPPFQALVTAGFLESTTRVVHLEPEAYPAFKIIVPFLKCEAIDMRTMPDSLPICADRWGLDDLFDACFAISETRHWPSIDRFMLFSLPLLRFLKVPNTFKHVFAVRLAYALDQIIDWVIGEEDYRIERLRSIPARTSDSESSGYPPFPNCSILVGGRPCTRPPKKELCRRYFCDEHYKSEYLKGSPRYGATLEDSSVPETTTCPPARKKKRMHHSTTDTPLQRNTSDKVPSFSSGGISKRVSVCGKTPEHQSQPQVKFNSLPQENGKPKDSFGMFVDSDESSAAPKTGSKDVAPCVKSRNAASSVPLCENGGEKAVSLSPVSTADERRTSLNRTSPKMRYLEKKRKGKKRNQHPKSEDREYALWDALRAQHMLAQALKELIWYAVEGYAGFILKGILRVLGNELTEGEKIKLLQAMPWERREFSSALGSNSHFTWCTSDWRIVAKAQALAAQAQAGGGQEYSKILRWPNLVQEVCDESGSYPAKCEKYGFIDDNVNEDLSIYVSWRTRKRCNGEYEQLLLNISNCEPNDLDEDVLERPLDISVSVREMDCGCEAGSEAKMPIVPRMFYGLLRADLKVRTLYTGPGITFTIMDDFEMSRWTRRHQPSCGLVLGLRIRVCDEIKKSAEQQSEGCTEEPLGRGKCPCGSCLEDDMSSDEGFAADIYSDQSDESDSDSDDCDEDDEDDDDDDNDDGDGVDGGDGGGGNLAGMGQGILGDNGVMDDDDLVYIVDAL